MPFFDKDLRKTPDCNVTSGLQITDVETRGMIQTL